MPFRRRMDRRPRINPGTPVELERGSSLAEGLQLYCVAWAGAGKLLDLVKPRISTAATWKSSPGGMTARNCSFTNAATTDVGFVGVTNWTILTYFFQNATLTAGQQAWMLERADYVSESNNRGWNVGLKSATDGLAPTKFAFSVFNNNSGNNYLTASTTNNAIGLWSLGGINRGTSSREFYVNGKLDKTTGSATAAITTTGTLTIGGSTQTQVLMAAAWNRALSVAELSDLHQRPFLLAKPAAAPVYFVPPAAGNRRRRVLLCSGGG